MPRKRPVVERLMEKVSKDTESDCWNWTGCVDRDGYGQVRSDAPGWPMVKAHRASYQLHCGPIPDGLVLDHLCRNRRCVNPNHLEPVTNRENMLRATALITHCVKGHEYTPENTGRDRNGRYCRICKRANYRKWAAKPEAREWRRQWQEARA